MKLTNHLRIASFGREYYYLKNIYPNWSKDLHNFGDTMEDEKLKLISKYGIIYWYFQHFCLYDIDYDYRYIYNYIENPQLITYSEYKYILLLDKFNDILPVKNLPKFKYEYYQKNNVDKSYYMKPFGYYLVDNYKDIDYKYIYDFIYDFIIKNNIYKLYDTFIDKNEECAISIRKANIKSDKFAFGEYKDAFESETFSNIDNILDIGIKFHRNKIILEKMSYKNNINDINEIYRLDKYVEELQEKMCNIVYDYINDYMHSVH